MLRQANRRLAFSLVKMLTAVAIVPIVFTVAALWLASMYEDKLESSALASMKDIQLAQAQYRAVFGRYACSLQTLGPPARGRVTPSAAGLIDGDLSRGEKGGYRFRLACRDDGYEITSVPVNPGATGNRTLCLDQPEQPWTNRRIYVDPPDLRRREPLALSPFVHPPAG